MFVVFDIGTSRLKVSAISLQGELLGQTAKRHSQFAAGGYAWQDTSEWWRNASLAFGNLMRRYGLHPKDVRGFSVSGRAGAGIFVDSKGHVLAEPWSDGRHRPMFEALRADYPGAPLYGLTLISKYAWLHENQPKKCGEIKHCFYAKDFLLFKLTGIAMTDPSSGPDAMSWFEQNVIDRELLPKPALPWSIAGELTSFAAEELGCRPGVPVAVGAHDGICANTGCAMLDENDYALTLGTHAVCRTVTEIDHGPAERFYCYPPDKHAYGGNSWHIGSTLSWILTGLADLSAELSPEELSEFNRQLEETETDPRLVFLPYLGGQTIPEKRSNGGGSFHGLSLSTARNQLIRVAFQGCAYAVFRTYREISGITGEASRIGLTGGGIVFQPWLQMLADLVEKEISFTDIGVEGRGAAVFCAVALGDYQDVFEAATAMQTRSTIIQPNAIDRLGRQQLEEFERLSAQT